MTNRVKQLWQEGKAAVNGWLAIPSGFSAEVMSKAGWDSLTVDIQHGVQDYQSMVACFQGMQANPVTPFVRVPWNEPGIIGKCLDGGAMGVICPMINTRAQAEAFVAACRYPPAGTRSNGPIRAGIYGEVGGYVKTANSEVLCMPMIETQEALDNLEAILDVPGINGVYIGPSDLGFSLGLEPRQDREEPQILKIYERVVKECAKRGIAPGVHNLTPAYAARMIGMGFRFVTIANDSGLMLRAALAAVAAVRQAAGGKA
ncbi:MAG: HpcH/HpaI aldolase family protein [Acetobacteraceae bacterium]